jgi:hypothetical protein
VGKKRNKLGYSIQRLFESQKSELFSILAFFLYFAARVAVLQNLYEYQLNVFFILIFGGREVTLFGLFLFLITW